MSAAAPLANPRYTLVRVIVTIIAAAIIGSAAIVIRSTAIIAGPVAVIVIIIAPLLGGNRTNRSDHHPHHSESRSVAATVVPAAGAEIRGIARRHGRLDEAGRAGGGHRRLRHREDQSCNRRHYDAAASRTKQSPTSGHLKSSLIMLRCLIVEIGWKERLIWVNTIPALSDSRRYGFSETRTAGRG